MEYFMNCKTLDELKAEYRRLAMKHHPDRGGDTATMQAINSEYEARFEILKKQHNETRDAVHQTEEAPQDFIDIINALLKLDGLNVELCGCWLWISGDTRKHKEALKAAGCKWSPNKSMWYWRPVYGSSPWHRGKKSIDQIRARYGSQRFTAAGYEQTGFEQLAGATA